MISIKESFADCFECKLYGNLSCVLETNCKYLDEVDVIFIAENPAREEVSHIPPVPLIGKAGQIFRKYFKLLDLDKQKYLLTNVVLCQTLLPDGKTGNPESEIIERCKVNCFNIIDECKPKIIVLMGSSAGKAFDLIPKGKGIIELRGNITNWNNYNILMTIHPSYIARGHREEEEKFKDDLTKVSDFLNGKKNQNIKNQLSIGKNEVFYYKIPEKFYTKDYKLLDVQYLRKTNEVLYIFRDKDNKKIYHKENDSYVCYQCPNKSEARLIMPYDKLNQIRIPYRQRQTLDPEITYEGDVKINVKHTQDYYLLKKEEEPNIPVNVMYLDIETYSETMENSTVIDANNIICIIGYKYGDKHITYVLDPKTILKDNTKKITPSEGIIICKDEKELINRFITDLKNLDPDVLTGWYSNDFDVPYIINRSIKLNINFQQISKFGEVDIDLKYGRLKIIGLVLCDLLALYKDFTFEGRESYSLDFISNLEIGEGKLGKGYNFSNMFREDPDQAIKYNQQDVMILPKLDNKLKLIELMNEVRKICKTTFDSAKNTMGQVDSLIVSYLKNKGISSRNSLIDSKDKYEGGFVKEPITGIHEYMVDFDFTSLYPSLILTYNIGVNTFYMKFEDYKLGYDFVYNKNSLPDKFKVILDPSFGKIEKIFDRDEFINLVKEQDLICTINGCFFKPHKDELSFLGSVCDFLLKSRKEYKKLMFKAKDDKDYQLQKIFDIKQQVYKILANAIYGVCGNNTFRFFDVDYARSITLSGQEMIKNSIIESDSFVSLLNKKEGQKIKSLDKNEIFGTELDREIINVVTSDTDSIFLTYKNLINNKESEDEILLKVLEWNEKVQTFLNKKMIPEIIMKHNVPIDFNRLELKNELVIKRGLFLAKKRYCLNVLLREGKKIDEIKAIGIETRRSDYPSFTKEKMNELLELILKSKVLSIPKILNFVKVTEKLFQEEIRNGSKSIAKPVSFNKKEKDYKVIPQGVTGMINFNNLEYKLFGVGSRGYLFKLLGIDLEKAPKNILENYLKNIKTKGLSIDEIVIPETYLKLPDYYIIDTKAILKFSWLDRCSLLLEPILKVNKLLTF